MVTLKQSDTGNGQSKLADQTLAREFPRQRAGEMVLIESQTSRLSPRALRAAVSDLTGRLSLVPSVAAIKSPLAAGNRGQLSRNRRAALVTFQITGDPD
jgi:hypothetical protein